jgi:hypothetical protein
MQFARKLIHLVVNPRLVSCMSSYDVASNRAPFIWPSHATLSTTLRSLVSSVKRHPMAWRASFTLPYHVINPRFLR